jgi:hypothetical protein
MAEIPADPVIPCSALPGGSGKTQESHPLTLPGGDIPAGFTDLGKGAQVMMHLHQFLITLFFELANWADKNLSQVQSSYPSNKAILVTLYTP